MHFTYFFIVLRILLAPLRNDLLSQKIDQIPNVLVLGHFLVLAGKQEACFDFIRKRGTY
jgi:hypothetical protein